MNWVNFILSGFISSLGIFLILKNLSKKKFTLSKSILFIILLSILFLICKYYCYGFIQMFCFVIIAILLCHTILMNKSLKDSFYYCIIYFILTSVVEVVISIFLLIVFNYKIDNYEQFQYSQLIFSIFNTLIVYFISKMKSFVLKVNKIKEKIIVDKLMILYIISFIIILLFLLVNNFLSYEKNIKYYINFFMILFIILVNLIVLYNALSKRKIESKYKEMMEYVSKYEQIINEQGKKNHEFNNQLMVLSGYIDNKKKLKEYLSSIIDEHKGGKNYMIEQLSYFPDGGIKGIIYHKLSKMDEYCIKPYLYVDKNSKEIFESKFDVKLYSDITKLFGVYIDNAIEAAKEAEIKEVEIDMKVDKDYLIVTIGNTYSKNIDIDKIGKKGFSTKGKGHGFGLSLVKDITKSNEKIETITDITNDMFKQIILIDLK